MGTRTGIAFLVLVLPTFAQTTWFVDVQATPPGNGTPQSPYTSVQEAISSPTTLSGDTVVVAPGVYPEAIRFDGKSLVVRSSHGPQSTAIVSTGLQQSAVSFADGEPAGARLEGFRIQGDPVQGVDGVGVRCVASDGELRDCILVMALQPPATQVRGGGGAVLAGGRLAFVRTTFTMCRVDEEGGAIFADGSTLRVDTCTIHDCGSTYERGGGIAAFGSVVDVSNSAFRDCRAHEDDGGAVFASGSSVRIVDTEFDANRVSNDHRGGALALEGGSAVIERCVFEDNLSARGGAIHSDAGAVLTVRGGHFLDNTAISLQAHDGSGGAIYALGLADVSFCTFSRNRSVSGPTQSGVGGAVRGCAVDRCTFFLNECDPFLGAGAAAARSTLKNSIVWESSPASSALHESTAAWCDVQGGAPGIGNIDADPLFVLDLAFVPRLLPGSPCIDAGDPASAPDLDGSRADMGAHAFYPAYGVPAAAYCTTKVTSAGCAPYLAAGTAPPSLSGGLFEVVARNVPENRSGRMLWGFARAGVPFAGGVLCVGNSPYRAPLQTSATGGGRAGCAGTFSFRWTSAYLASVAMVPSIAVHAQYWFRDPADPDHSGLSNALSFTFVP